MSYRVVAIQNPSKLSLSRNQLVITQENREFSVSIEDISTLILDDSRVLLTVPLIQTFSKNNISVIITGENHHPISQILPVNQASLGAKNSRNQLEISETLRKNLWRGIVANKIENQSKALEIFRRKKSIELLEISKNILINDKTNRESLAARIYFNEILDGRTRREPMFYNSALNYGYSLIRSKIAQQIVAFGLIPQVGIHHKNSENAFNLADDLIEPFRAIVDVFALSQIREPENDMSLKPENREILLNILNEKVLILGKKQKIYRAVEMYVESFVSSIKNRENNLAKIKFNGEENGEL